MYVYTNLHLVAGALTDITKIYMYCTYVSEALKLHFISVYFARHTCIGRRFIYNVLLVASFERFIVGRNF